MQLESLSAIELGRRIAAGELTSVAVTEYFLERSKALNPKINALVSFEDRALELASQADARLAELGPRSALDGVPIAIKDILCMAGTRTTCGSRMLSDYIAPYTATAVERLLAAGLIPLGKTNMDEFAMGGSTETSIYGPTRNPWDPARTAGGSSGGSAACLAAGMAPLAIGTDTGGSVRQPSAYCGVVGLKPTYGRISRFGLIAFASSFDQIGPMAHHVEDVAALLQILAGPDPRDSTCLPDPADDYRGGLTGALQGLRVGLVREQVDHPDVAPEVRQAVLRAAAELQRQGAVVTDAHLSLSKYAVPTYYVVATSEASGNLSRYDGVHYGFRDLPTDSEQSPLVALMCRTRSRGFGAEVKRRIMLGTFALSAGYYDAYYKKALKVRRLIRDQYLQALEQVDVLLGPVAPTPAFPLQQNQDDPVRMYLQDQFTVGANLAGIPSMAVPAGSTADGLPLAVQIQGPPLSESRLLNVAYQLEQARFFVPRIAQA
ncbi:MAG: Asp-tRNA(Asn)/Glu-tRNA(Gln) amidotransferase subunit GatA [Planctomycetota bacterium]|nr:MAG: Asp-tRNA(Asn)/Glu-tRNA(Gln) amidotransferase subunit GatA [Planctomycetota bacterium]